MQNLVAFGNQIISGSSILTGLTIKADCIMLEMVSVRVAVYQGVLAN